MNAEDVLARVFGAFEAFVAQLHASLVLTGRPVSAVALDASGVSRKLAFQLYMAVYGRHRNSPLRHGKARGIPEGEAAVALQKKDLKELSYGWLSDIAHGVRDVDANFNRTRLLENWTHSLQSEFDGERKLRQKKDVGYPAKFASGTGVANFAGFQD